MMIHDAYCPNCDFKLQVEEYVSNYVIIYFDAEKRIQKFIDNCPNCNIRLKVENGVLVHDKL